MFAAAALADVAAAACPDALRVSAARAERSITAGNLVTLREIGHPDSALFGLPSPVAIDPTGREAAFIVSEADPVGNGNCRSLIVVPINGEGTARTLDRGGEHMTQFVNRAGVSIDSGSALVVTPRWSPDGSSIAYLRRDRGVTQIWLAPSKGGLAYPVTRSEADVAEFTWTAHGHDIIYSTQPDRADWARAMAREGLSGFLYDERAVPSIGARPQPPGQLPVRYFSVSIEGKQVRPLDNDLAMPKPPNAKQSTDGSRASLVPDTPSPLSPPHLRVTLPTGKLVSCRAASCQGRITGFWWADAGRTLVYLRREGWANGDMGLYRWSPRRGVPKRILATGDALNGCTPALRELICLREDAVRPRHLVAIDLSSGALRPVFDPNPQTRAWQFGPVQRIAWRNDRGLEAYGDLVLPPGVERPRDLPLIVVQYNSVGFLRGGTGDEYPIHLFAAHGFAVLSVQQPIFVAAAMPDIRTGADINRVNLAGWAERRSLLSSLEIGIARVIDMGIADPRRIGITGLSDGASTARFAMINSDLFAAAAISSCCLDPHSMMTYAGPAYADQARVTGYPAATARDDAFWRPFSLALNASRISIPLLMHLPDDEYLLALEAFTALREHNKPVELYVFPGEHHTKTQPAHRLAIYRRNLDWFRFWLQSRTDPDPAKRVQYTRWHAMRESLASKAPALRQPTAATPRHR